MRGVQTLVSHVHLPVVLAEPARSDSAARVPALSGLLSALTDVSRLRLPSASSTCCDRPKAVSFHHRTVEQRLVALDVRYPQLVGYVSGELTADSIGGGGMRRGLPIPGTAGEAPDAGRAHHLLDRLVANRDALSEDQFCVHASCTVGAP